MKKRGIVPASIIDADLVSVHVVADPPVAQFPSTARMLLLVDGFIGHAAITQDFGLGFHWGVQVIGMALVAKRTCHLRSGRFDGLVRTVRALIS